jgi:hypothetical protein
MKRTLHLLLSFCLIFSFKTLNAQVEPDVANLTHFWSFEDGTADDEVNNADGTLMNDAVIDAGQLLLLDTTMIGAYLSIPGDVVQVNTYNELSFEIWCTPAPNTTALHSGNNMTAYFGGVNSGGWAGISYLYYGINSWSSTTPHAGISAENTSAGYLSEEGVDVSGALGDSVLRHHIITLKDDTLKIFIDGALMASTGLSRDSSRISYLSNDTILFGRGGYSGDQTWKGSFDLIAIWSNALSADEILWLYNQGSLRALTADTTSQDTTTSVVNLKRNEQSINIYYSNNRLFMSGENSNSFVDLSVTIYNINGCEVYCQDNFQSGSSLNLLPGVYIAEIYNKSYRLTKKVIVK